MMLPGLHSDDERYERVSFEIPFFMGMTVTICIYQLYMEDGLCYTYSMNEPILVFLKEEVSTSFMSDLLNKAGGTYDGNSHPPEGRISKGEASLWIFPNAKEVGLLDQASRTQVSELLKGQPVSCLVIEPSRFEGTSDLMKDFLLKMFDRTRITASGTDKRGEDVWLSSKENIDEWLQKLI